MASPPVLHDKATRDRYDQTWGLYPWEHPSAYWLRANEHTAVCTRCSAHFVSEEHEPKDEKVFEGRFNAWVALHLACPLGRGHGAASKDPLFEEGE